MKTHVLLRRPEDKTEGNIKVVTLKLDYCRKVFIVLGYLHYKYKSTGTIGAIKNKKKLKNHKTIRILFKFVNQKQLLYVEWKMGFR